MSCTYEPDVTVCDHMVCAIATQRRQGADETRNRHHSARSRRCCNTRRG